MSEAILKFNLPEEQEEFEFASNAGKMHLALWDIKQQLRNHLKHDENMSEEVHRAVENIRDELFEILDSRGISHLF
jgi:hypothetical protein